MAFNYAKMKGCKCVFLFRLGAGGLSMRKLGVRNNENVSKSMTHYATTSTSVVVVPGMHVLSWTYSFCCTMCGLPLQTNL